MGNYFSANTGVNNNKLVILDINKTLVDRIYIKKDISGRVPDFVVRGLYNVYKRPNVDKFIEYLMLNCDYNVGIWTSCSSINDDEIITHLFGDKLKNLKFIYSRDQFDTKLMRDLQRVWENKNWNNENTVFITTIDTHTLKSQMNNIINISKFEAGNNNDNALLDVITKIKLFCV